ncbi:hypothetical protein ACQWTT_001320 [Acinetobacter baumannii]
MGLISKLFKNIENKQNSTNVDQKSAILEQNFILCGNVYRNRDNSVPDLEQFLKLNLSIDDYVYYVHGKSQKDLQNQLAFKSNAKRITKKATMDKRLNLKAQKSQNKSKRIDGLQNEFYDFGMFAPFGVYHAANKFGLHTLNQYNLATGSMMGGVFLGMGAIDPSTTMFDETATGLMNQTLTDDMREFNSSSNDLF